MPPIAVEATIGVPWPIHPPTPAPRAFFSASADSRAATSVGDADTTAGSWTVRPPTDAVFVATSV